MSTRWRDLPPELSLMILENVAAGYPSGYVAKASSEYTRLAQYSPVSREWQTFFERIIFKHIILDQSHLSVLKSIIEGDGKKRLGYIRHLWLRVKLDKYDCKVCRKAENEATIARNNAVFTKAMHDLLTILAAANDVKSRHGLQLELSVHSESDYQHVYRDFRLRDDYPFITEADLEDGKMYREYHRTRLWSTVTIKDLKHGFRGPGMQRRTMTPGQKKRLRGTLPLSFSFEDPTTVLPRVDIVRGLVTRRQFYRNISAKALAQLLRESLGSLCMFRYEQMCDIGESIQISAREDIRDLLLPHLPPSLERLYLYQGGHSAICISAVVPMEPSLGVRLAKTSCQLMELASSVRVCAPEFLCDFATCVRDDGKNIPMGYSWPRLEYLVLHMPRLGLINDNSVIASVLSAASFAVSLMPKLRVMEIWDSRAETAAIFRYSNKGGDNPRLTWRRAGGDGRPLHPALVRNWERTARCHGHRDLVVEIEPLPFTAEELHGFSGSTMLDCLELKKLVLDPRSLCQVQFERRYGMCF
ncbi:hypothetical protein ACJ41O_007552 [Fusarium nematophilum]